MSSTDFYSNAERLTFIAEWFHAEANIAKTFYVFYFPIDNDIEIFDQKTKKTFLRRIKLKDDNINVANFYIGAKLNLFGRQYDIIDYGDLATKSFLEKIRQKTLCIIKPDVIYCMGEILTVLIDEEFSFNNCIMVKLTDAEASRFYENESNDNITPLLIENLTSSSILAIELISKNAVEKLKTITGPGNPNDAKQYAPNSLRARFGKDLIKNGIYCSESNEQANRDLDFFFGNSASKAFQSTANFNNCTIGIVKPHVIREGKLGKIITTITENGFKINAMRMFILERKHSEEFYEVYKNVVPEFVPMVIELASGSIIAMEIEVKDSTKNSYSQFRKLCGPNDPIIARQLRPNTIRAKFGINKIQNAIHCTDLEEDTVLEIEYFFKILK